jgi:hypothetical protein
VTDTLVAGRWSLVARRRSLDCGRSIVGGRDGALLPTLLLPENPTVMARVVAARARV